MLNSKIEKFLKYFSEEEVKRLNKYGKISTVITFLSLSLYVYVYVVMTFLEFFPIGANSYYFNYSDLLDAIGVCSVITWIAVFLIWVNVLIMVYLLRFTINPHIEILRVRKDIDLKILEEEIKEFKNNWFYRLLIQIFLIITFIISLNYYPRNAQLFYPFIGCDPDTLECIITSEAYIPYVIVMTSILIVIILLIILYNVILIREYRIINSILFPNKYKKRIEKKKEFLEKKAKKQSISIEERRKLRIEKIRSNYQQKIVVKREKRNKRFEKIMEREKFGKKGYQILRKEDKGKKEIGKIKKRKDEFDYT